MYKRNVQGWTKHLDFIIDDCVCLIVAFFTAFWIRNGFQSLLDVFRYRELLFAFVGFDLILIVITNTMKSVLKRDLLSELKITVRHSFLLLVIVTAYLFFTKTSEDFSRVATLLTVIGYSALAFATRVLLKKVVTEKFNRKEENALIIIANETIVETLILKVKNQNYGKNKIVGAVLPFSTSVGKEIDGVRVVASYDSVVEYAKTNWVDEALISISREVNVPSEVIDELLEMGIAVHYYLDNIATAVNVKQVPGSIGGLPTIISTINYMTPGQALLKRVIDIAGGLVGCLLTGVIYLFVAPAIKRESPGPVFFTQTRVGKNGKTFKIYKFRSMYLDAEQRKKELMEQNRVKDGLMFKLDFDPRVIGNKIDNNGNQQTGIGEVIRKYSLDEFPQFYNVLRGDMSLVGTRPPLLDEYQAYDFHHKARLAAKPGITGIWQVSGRSNIVDFEEVVRLDKEYISNWSLWLDIKIILKTILVVIRHEGSM